MENLKDFLSMSEEEKIRRIKSLDPEEVIRILTSVGTNALSAELLNQLAVAYNNSIQPEKAMETLDLVKEQEAGCQVVLPVRLCLCRYFFASAGKEVFVPMESA